MKNSEMLFAVADAVEKQVAKGKVCNWWHSDPMSYTLFNVACPGYMYGIENGILDANHSQINLNPDLLQRISDFITTRHSELTNTLRSYGLEQDKIDSFYTSCYDYRKGLQAYAITTPEAMREVANILQLHDN